MLINFFPAGVRDGFIGLYPGTGGQEKKMQDPFIIDIIDKGKLLYAR